MNLCLTNAHTPASALPLPLPLRGLLPPLPTPLPLIPSPPSPQPSSPSPGCHGHVHGGCVAIQGGCDEQRQQSVANLQCQWSFEEQGLSGGRRGPGWTCGEGIRHPVEHLLMLVACIPPDKESVGIRRWMAGTREEHSLLCSDEGVFPSQAQALHCRN